jgi:hypothetical protein
MRLWRIKSHKLGNRSFISYLTNTTLFFEQKKNMPNQTFYCKINSSSARIKESVSGKEGNLLILLHLSEIDT